jgi:quinoprotein glucose dehydrogenase
MKLRPVFCAPLAVLALAQPLSRAADVAPAPAAGPAASTPYHLLINPAPGLRKATPVINAASDEAVNALQRIKPAAGLEVKLWAAEPMLANPVAFNIDERGRVFVAETYRYRSSTLDIRHYLWMDQEDLASRTIEDRLDMLQRNFGPEGVKELSVESEIIRLVEDTKGAGVADRSSVYADGFNSPLDGIASGIMVRRGEVWFTDIPSIWKMTGEQKAETRTEISRGYGVHFSLTGHDLHGPTWGPDGKIYFSFGDRGASVKTKEGITLNTPDNGAVYRMNPDGTQLEIFADGLRNPQSLLFTENGDMVIGDNDSDGPDEERLVHAVEGGESGWRIGYQRSPLAPTEQKGPWSAEKMWLPRWEGQAAFLLPPICNIEDGNSGVAYYPGTGLNSSYFGQIFICHFKGAQARSGINTYLVKPKGSSYEIADSKVFVSSVLPTDVRFGPDGKVYLSDWTDGYDQPKKGRIYTISDPQHLNDPLVKETQQLLGGDWTKRSSDELAKLLGHADWRVRLEAQFTLAERADARRQRTRPGRRRTRQPRQSPGLRPPPRHLGSRPDCPENRQCSHALLHHRPARRPAQPKRLGRPHPPSRTRARRRFRSPRPDPQNTRRTRPGRPSRQLHGRPQRREQPRKIPSGPRPRQSFRPSARTRGPGHGRAF